MTLLKSRGWFSSCLPGCALMLALFLIGNAMAQNDAATRFPDAARVIADYPDPVQSYVALNLLWDTLHEKSTSPQAVSKRASYYNASTGIRQQRIMDAKAGFEFDDKVRKLTADANFRRSVLEKYQVANVPKEVPRVMHSTDVSDAMIKRAFLKGLPFMLAGLVAMYLIMKSMICNATASPSLDASTLPADNLPQLPESLRVVKVPGTQYSVGVLSGMVLDKESSTKTNFVTTTTPGQVYAMGNQLYTTGARTTTTATTTQTDLVWIRTPQGRETSWTFTGGSFKTRAGHMLSVIARAVKDGMQFMMAYNHTTGQFEVLGANAAHLNARGRWAWPLAAVIGAFGFAIAYGILFNLQPQDNPSPLGPIIYPIAFYIEGLFTTLFLGLFMVLRIKKKNFQKRNAAFDRDYLPKFREFLQQRTNAVETHFGLPPRG